MKRRLVHKHNEAYLMPRRLEALRVFLNTGNGTYDDCYLRASLAEQLGVHRGTLTGWWVKYKDGKLDYLVDKLPETPPNLEPEQPIPDWFLDFETILKVVPDVGKLGELVLGGFARKIDTLTAARESCEATIAKQDTIIRELREEKAPLLEALEQSHKRGRISSFTLDEIKQKVGF